MYNQSTPPSRVLHTILPDLGVECGDRYRAGGMVQNTDLISVSQDVGRIFGPYAILPDFGGGCEGGMINRLPIP